MCYRNVVLWIQCRQSKLNRKWTKLVTARSGITLAGLCFPLTKKQWNAQITTYHAKIAWGIFHLWLLYALCSMLVILIIYIQVYIYIYILRWMDNDGRYCPINNAFLNCQGVYKYSKVHKHKTLKFHAENFFQNIAFVKHVQHNYNIIKCLFNNIMHNDH